MKVAAYRKTATVLALACLLSLAACAGGNAPVHFYMLSPLAKTESAAILNTDMPAIGVGPVTMAAYLDRPQIITRSGRTVSRYTTRGSGPKFRKALFCGC